MLVLPAVPLAACVSVGNPAAVDELAVSRLTPLRSTQQDVVRSMDAPTHPGSIAMLPRSSEKIVEIWTYDYTHVDISPLTFIPLFGPFLGGSPVTSGSVVARFDQDGVLQHVDQAPHFDPRLGHDSLDFPLVLY